MQVRRLIPDPEFYYFLFEGAEAVKPTKGRMRTSKALYEWSAGAALSGLLLCVYDTSEVGSLFHSQGRRHSVIAFLRAFVWLEKRFLIDALNVTFDSLLR